MLNYVEMSPKSRLSSYVRKFWILDNSTCEVPAATKYALPNTCFTLALIWGNGVIVDFPDKATHMTAGNYMVGELTTKISVTVLPYTKAFMVQLVLGPLPYLAIVHFMSLPISLPQLWISIKG